MSSECSRFTCLSPGCSLRISDERCNWRLLLAGLAVVFAAQAMQGCGGGGMGSPESPPPESDQTSTWHGRYVGTAEINGVTYFADALFAASGESHLYIGGPYGDSG